MSCGTPDTASCARVSTTRLSLSLVQLSVCFVYTRTIPSAVHTPLYISINRFGLFPFRSPLLRKSFVYFLFLRVLRCFSSPGSPIYTMYSCIYTVALPTVSSLIRKSTDQSLFAAPRSFSQLIASFIGAKCQGIHYTLFIA